MNPYQAVPGGTLYVEGVCSRTGAPIMYVNKGEKAEDQVWRWFCREIVLGSQIADEIETGLRAVGYTEDEKIKHFYLVPATAICPTCGDNSGRFAKCAQCHAINCWGSVQKVKLGKWWQRNRPVADDFKCGACGHTGHITTTITSVDAVRDTGPSHEPTASKQTGLVKTGKKK